MVAPLDGTVITQAIEIFAGGGEGQLSRIYHFPSGFASPGPTAQLPRQLGRGSGFDFPSALMFFHLFLPYIVWPNANFIHLPLGNGLYLQRAYGAVAFSKERTLLPHSLRHARDARDSVVAGLQGGRDAWEHWTNIHLTHLGLHGHYTFPPTSSSSFFLPMLDPVGKLEYPWKGVAGVILQEG